MNPNGTRRWFLSGSIATGASAMFACVPGGTSPSRTRGDTGAGGIRDSGLPRIDSGLVDASRRDSGFADSGTISRDSGATPADSGHDAGRSDTGQIDAGHPDAAVRDSGAADSGQTGPCVDPFAGGQFIGNADFVESSSPLERVSGSGLDGRLYTDLSRLDENYLIIPNDRYFIRTRYPDQLDPNRPWNIRVHGQVTTELNLAMSNITPLVRPMGTVVFECSGNGEFASFGMLSAAEWSGVPLMEIVQMAGMGPGATRVLVSGFDRHSQPSSRSTAGASWIFTFEDITRYGGFLATHMNGVELPRDHGYPIRLVMPRWYGCVSIKWVDEIQLVDGSAQATSQMREFASRTHQNGTPALARDYLPASMDQAAMPVRIEKWRMGGRVMYRVVGVMWGGYALTDRLQVRFGANGRYQDVDVCPPQSTNDTWTLWSHAWTPATTGSYTIRCRIDDPMVRTRRLDSGFYDRVVQITEV